MTEIEVIKNETHFRSQVVRLALSLGLLVYAIPDSRQMEGSPGFPDLVVAGPDGCMFIELKMDVPTSRLSEKQTAWKWTLTAAGEAWRLFRPRDLKSGEIESELRLLV